MTNPARAPSRTADVPGMRNPTWKPVYQGHKDGELSRCCLEVKYRTAKSAA